MPPEQLAALLRAARGYSDLTVEQLAKRAGVGSGAFENWTSSNPDRLPKNGPSRDQLNRIADVAQVPRRFFEVGFEPLWEPISDLRALVYELRARVDALEQRDEGFSGVLEPGSPSNAQAAPGSSKRARATPRRGRSAPRSQRGT